MTTPTPTGAPINVLVVDDESNIRKTLAICLEAEGHHVTAVGNFQDAVAEASRRTFHMAFVDLRLGTASGLDLIPVLLSGSPWMKIVVITAYASIDTAVEAMRRGATDYIPKPFTPAQVLLAVRKVEEVRTLEQKVAALREDLERTAPEVRFSSDSPAMQRAMEIARQVAPTDAAVLLRGESGTGKTVLARAIHGWSRRSGKPFGVVSCPSLPPELLTSELFGHVKGAFTGAVRDNPGRIAACEGGTLFLDEIGDLPLPLQPKLLRFLQDQEYEPARRPVDAQGRRPRHHGHQPGPGRGGEDGAVPGGSLLSPERHPDRDPAVARTRPRISRRSRRSCSLSTAGSTTATSPVSRKRRCRR